MVLVFTDDLGYGDVGVYGSRTIRTPHIDRLAREGVRFTDFYVAQAVCSASRAALLTGAYPNRPHTMPHVPIFASERFGGRSRHGLYADVVEEIDDSVGQLTAALRRLGLAERTLVIFTSDNGPWLSYGDHAGTAGPLREGKGTAFEGGVRVPFVARWPRHIPAGSLTREPAMTIDLLPTIARLVGAPLPPLPIDGQDISPLLLGEPGARSPHEALYFYYGSELRAVRSGRHKLVLPHRSDTLEGPAGQGGTPGKYVKADVPLALYDLVADIGETTDLAAQQPEVVGRLQALADRARDDLGDSLVKRTGRGAREPGRVE